MKPSRKSKRTGGRKTARGEAVILRTARLNQPLSVEEGIREGLEDAKAGRLRPVSEFFAWFEKSHRLGTRNQPKRKSVPRSKS